MAENGRAPLTNAPPADGPPPEAKPSRYAAEFLLETPEGFHVLLRGEDLTPRDIFPWILRASKDLAAQGFKPLRRDSQAVAVAAPARQERPANDAPRRARRNNDGDGDITPNRDDRPSGRAQVEKPDECPECGNGVYDNRAKKRSGAYKRNAPDFACMDKGSCGLLGWVTKDGAIDWKFPRD